MNKRNWGDTVTRLYAEIPEARDVDLGKVFKEDPKILGNLINDVIKVNISEKGRPGKRSASSEHDIADDLRKLNNEDFSNSDFCSAMRFAMRNKSLRQVARESGLDKMVVRRLLNGEGEPPTVAHMEALAHAFRKHPSYFKEYRAAFVCGSVYQMLINDGDSSVILYNKLKGTP